MFGDGLNGPDLLCSQITVFVGQNLLETLDILDQHILVTDGRGYDVIRCHVGQNARFDLDLFDQVLHIDLISGMDLRFVEDVVLFEQLDVLLAAKDAEGVGDTLDALQSPFLGLFQPLLAVAVALETNLFRGDDVFTYDLKNGLVFFYTLVDQFVDLSLELGELFGNGRIDRNQWSRTVVRRARCTELEPISGERER